MGSWLKDGSGVESPVCCAAGASCLKDGPGMESAVCCAGQKQVSASGGQPLYLD